MHHSYVQKYLEMYAKHFDLIKHIYFNTEVIEVSIENFFSKDFFQKNFLRSVGLRRMIKTDLKNGVFPSPMELQKYILPY